VIRTQRGGTVSGLEASIVVAAVGVALATLGALAAINFKDVVGRQIGLNANRFGLRSWAEWGTDSFYYRSQLWFFRAFGGAIAFAGIVLFVMAWV
jgi:hypothetical protein